MQYQNYTQLPPWAESHFENNRQPSNYRPQYIDYPYEKPYAWDINTNPNDNRMRPISVNPPPEGYQIQHSSTHPPYRPPTLPQMYSTIEPANIQQYVKNQPSMFVDPRIYPEEKQWDQMNPYEQQVKVEQDARDVFIQKLFLDVDDLISERQFDRMPNHDPIEGREAYMQFLHGDYSLASHYKDKWGYLYQKYHTNP